MSELTVAAKADLAKVGITITTDAKTGKEIATHPSGVKSEIPTCDKQLTELDARIADLQDQRAAVDAMYETEK